MKCFAAAFVLCLGLFAADPIVGLGGMTVSDFKYKGDGYLLEGAKATTTGDRIRIQDAKATIVQGDDVLVITTPLVVFNRVTQRGSGDDKVVMQSTSGNLRMEGTGFDADFRRQRVRIRRDAVMKIRNVALRRLPEAGKIKD